MPAAAVFIGDQRGLVCGVCLYPTEGPYCLVEHLSTNPACGARLRHRGVLAAARTLRGYLSVAGKYPVMVIRHRALVRILAREGFRSMPGVVMSSDIGVAL